jgi:hypothetical protein
MGLSKIYWPQHITQPKNGPPPSGYVIGWVLSTPPPVPNHAHRRSDSAASDDLDHLRQLSDTDSTQQRVTAVFVVDVLEGAAEHVRAVIERCNEQLHQQRPHDQPLAVLGYMGEEHAAEREHFEGALWLTLQTRARWPALVSLQHGGTRGEHNTLHAREASAPSNVIFILYQQRVIDVSHEHAAHNSLHSKLLATITRACHCALTLHRLAAHSRETSRARVGPVHDSMVSALGLVWLRVIWLLTRVMSPLAVALISFMNRRISLPLYGNVRSLRESSLIGEQLDHRFKLVREWHALAGLLIEQARSDEPLSHVPDRQQLRDKYLTMCNQLLIVTIDVLAGISAMLFIAYWLMTSEQNIIPRLTQLYNSHIISMTAWIEWLMLGWPAGVKLNYKLDLFLGQILLFYIQHWALFITTLANSAAIVWTIIALTSLLCTQGLTMLSALFFDIVSVACTHIFWLFAALQRTYNLQIRILSSLWMLFQGKKHNVLKQRVDSCDYEIDQLLLGTLLFAMLFFLLPTLISYYTFLASLFALTTAAHLLAQIVFSTVYHFPLYQIWLYFFNRTAYLEISFKILQWPQQLHTESSSVYFELKVRPSHLSIVRNH